MEDVLVAVVVEVLTTRAPTPVSLAGSGGGRLILEDVPDAVLVAVHAVAVAATRDVVNARHEPVEVAVEIVVADGCAHAVLVGDDRWVGHVGECAIRVVEEHLAVAEVGRQSDVEPPVVVDVGEVRCERLVGVFAGLMCGNAGGEANVGEGTISVVAPEKLIDGPVADLRKRPVRDERVEVAVAVVVRKRCRDVVFSRERKVGALVGERAIAVVAVELRWFVVEAGHVQIEIAVPVVVGEDGTAAEHRVVDLRRSRDLFERTVALVAVEQVRAGVTSNDEKIDPAVVVVVAGRDAATEDPLVAGGATRIAVRVRDLCGRGDVGEGPDCLRGGCES